LSQSFTLAQDTLHSFFSQPGRGFYIPHYQRNYSWDDENAKKLVSDVLSGITRTLTKKDNSVFLGTVILHDEKKVTVGVHADTPNLLTKISNVVDGQQRISSIAMLTCVLSNRVSEIVAKLKSSGSGLSEVANLITELSDEEIALREFYSVAISKIGANPSLKPIVIRAADTSASPVSDQWTLKGLGTSFYKSNTSTFLAQFIDGVPLQSIKSTDRITSVVEVFRNELETALSTCDAALSKKLVLANATVDGSLYGFTGYPPDLTKLKTLSGDDQAIFHGGLLMKAACSFLRNACHLVAIECADEELAFDMFQSLNATGTPLTAFEVFKPMVVNDWGPAYGTGMKLVMDRIEKVFETESTASGKEELTDAVIVSSALVFNGDERSRKFSDERDWLFKTYPKPQSLKAREFLECLADQAEYCLNVIQPKKPSKNSTSFPLVDHLMHLGLNTPNADLAALCIYYLREAGHQFAHSVLSVFYARLVQAQSGSGAAKAHAADAFLEICQATAAFFTLWMGALPGRFPDEEYRQLFQAPGKNISINGGKTNQTSAFVKKAFGAALEKAKIYNATSATTARKAWVGEAKNKAWYARRAVCRFGLFLSAHDAAPDLASGKEGLFVNGKKKSADMLNCLTWHSSEFEVIEHIAVRDRPAGMPKFPTHFDVAIYPGNYSVVDRIGNLTLLSTKINSSIYSEWPDKVYYYWSLTTPTSTAAGPSSTALMSALGITALPPSLTTLSAASSHLPHLAPLAYRGQQGKTWDVAFIEHRSEHLCQRIFDKIDGWLR
jgi:hypothetical protein